MFPVHASASDGVLNPGHNPDSVPDVRGIDRTSRNIKRLRGVPDILQVRKHFVEAQPDQPRNILSNNPSGPEFRHNSEHFRPEMAVILLASLLPGDTERLAREPSANKVNWGEAGGAGGDSK
jgi:hypothetical protein